MFSGDDYVRFTSDQDPDQVYADVQYALEALGTPYLNKRGQIDVNPRRNFDSFLSRSTLVGSIRTKGNEYRVHLEHDSGLSAWGWLILIIGILFFLVGLLVILAPMFARNKIQRAVRRVLLEMDSSWDQNPGAGSSRSQPRSGARLINPPPASPAAAAQPRTAKPIPPGGRP